MQRNVHHLLVVNHQRVGDHLVALLDVDFALDRLNQLVELGVADAAEIEVAVAALADGHRQRLQRIERVECRHAPAQQVKRRVVLLNLRKVRCTRHRVQRHLESELRPHRNQRLADLFVVDVAVVRTVERHGEAVGIAGRGQQLLGLFLVVRQALVRRRNPAVDCALNDRTGRVRRTTHHCLLDRFDVDRLVQRLANAHVFERILTLYVAVLQLVTELIHPDKNRAVLGAFDDLDRGRLLKARDVLRHRIKQKIDLTRQQCRGTRRVGLDRRVDHFGDVALLVLRAPPVRIGYKHCLDVHFARLQHERPGAVGIARRVRFFLLHEVLRRNDLVLLRPPFVDDPQLGQLAQQHWIGHCCVDDHRVVINRVRALHTYGVLAEVRRRLHRTLDRKHHIGRGQGRTVVKLHALAQIEAPDQRRFLLPVGRERGHHFELFVIGDERLVDIRVGSVIEPFVLRVRVHRQDVSLAGPAQSLGVDTRCDTKCYGKCGDSETHRRSPHKWCAESRT